MQEFAPALFSTKVSAGRNTYFFDVKNTKKDKPYLKISQSWMEGEEKKRANLNIFDSDITDFAQALTQAVDFMNQSAK